MKLERSPLAPDAFPDLPDVKGVRAATASRGFYAKLDINRDDVFLFTFEPGTVAAGVFTTSRTASADVLHCRHALSSGESVANALLAHAGNSNAFTGEAGVEKNTATLDAIYAELNAEADTCFLAATGVIGEPLEDRNYIGSLVPDLSRRLGTPDWLACARAFMTTDTFPKGAGQKIMLGGHEVSFAGIAKGSGMIAPNMSTMLAYVFTDAAIDRTLLDEVLREVTDESFNSVTVDGDTSTSDTFMVFATGKSGMPPIETRDDDRFGTFFEALKSISLDLAKQLVRDGEGASKFITVRVSGASDNAGARAVAAAIANSPLVKTALAAGDANWGRVVMAAGKAGVDFDQSNLAIWFGDHLVASAGRRSPDYNEARASEICAEQEITIRVKLGDGDGAASVYTCDLTHAYIDINGAYRT